jgi:hypothetical protein
MKAEEYSKPELLTILDIISKRLASIDKQLTKINEEIVVIDLQNGCQYKPKNLETR